MSNYQDANYTTTGEKTMFVIEPEKNTYLLINAPSDASYDVQIRLDSSGNRVTLGRETGDAFLALIESGFNGEAIGLNVISLPSGSIDFEVLSEIAR